MGLPDSRRVIGIARSGHVAIRTEPIPSLESGQLLIRARASLISAGTELGHFRGRPRTEIPEEPYRSFGYQNAGEVAALGEGCRGFTVGQRVACMGAGRALHADYAVVQQGLTVPLPDAVSDVEGAFAALAPTAMHAVRRGEVVFGEEILVVGLGLVGQLTAQVCSLAGARVMAMDPMPLRVETARKCGIDGAMTDVGDAAVRSVLQTTGGAGLDCAFLCFGGEATGALQDVVKMMKQAPDSHRWGRVVIVGGATVTHGFGAALGNLDLRSAARTGPGYHDPAYERGADYPPVFVRWSTGAHLRLFVRWAAEGKLRLKELVTDEVSIEDAPAACYALMDDPAAHLGVVIRYG